MRATANIAFVAAVILDSPKIAPLLISLLSGLLTTKARLDEDILACQVVVDWQIGVIVLNLVNSCNKSLNTLASLIHSYQINKTPMHNAPAVN